MIAKREFFELAVQPECNIVCFRLVKKGWSAEALDELNRSIRKRLVESGKFYIVQTQLNGRQWLRSTLGSPFTDARHLEALLDEIERLGAEN